LGELILQPKIEALELEKTTRNWIGGGKRGVVKFCGNLREKMEIFSGKVRDWGLVVVFVLWVWFFFFCFVFEEMIGLERKRETRYESSVELNRRRRFKWTVSLTKVVGPTRLSRVTAFWVYLFVVVSLWHQRRLTLFQAWDSLPWWPTNNINIFLLFSIILLLLVYFIHVSIPKLLIC